MIAKLENVCCFPTNFFFFLYTLKGNTYIYKDPRYKINMFAEENCFRINLRIFLQILCA